MAKTHWHTLESDQAMEKLKSGPEGIEANTAKSRLDKYGPNELAVQKGTSPLTIFLSQFKDLMVIILIIATIISAALGEWIDTIVILIIVILNSLFGFFQEYKAEKALLALQKMSAPQAAVIRDGKEVLIPARELVPGDIIILRTGDMVPADARLFESVNLKVNESALTGESKAVVKDFGVLCQEDAFVGDMENMVFSSTMVEYGRGKAVVVRTGMNTEIGRIAQLIRGEQLEQTPLQQKLDKMGRQIGALILLICGLVFVVELIRSGGQNVLELFMVAVSLAVAAIPEGLPAVVTISLALGLQRMVKRHALIRRLPAVETLGSTTVICSDKTGTLTMGVMNIKLIKTLDRSYEVEGEGYEPVGEFSVGGEVIDPGTDATLKQLLMAGALCNDSTLEEEGGRWAIKGDSTEGAFLVAAQKAGMGHGLLNEEFPRIAENPFDSDRKYMTTINNDIAGNFKVFAKGATDRLLTHCTRKLEGGTVQPLTEDDVKKIHEMNDDMASHAYRVLALAYKESDDNIGPEDAESDLIFIGLAGMIDAPRKEAIAAVKECKKAGIRVVMITGDHKLTAIAIARQMGIAGPNSEAFTGQELNKMSDEELFKHVERIAVYARVSPEHKMRIINAWRKRGHIVAMTGDGVNDAPALKKADIGVAMGITGTDVSKEAAEMVLTDDNFASIVHAVEEGRNIYSNIRKFVSFLLSCNVGEVLTIFIATLLFSFSEPFLFPLQILWMNLVTDGLPALALGLEPPDPDAMEHPPKDPDEPPINRQMLASIMVVGIIVAAGTLIAFLWKYDASLTEGTDAWNTMMEEARTIAFTTIVLFQMSYVISARSLQLPIYKIGFWTNKYLLAAAGGSVLLQMMVVYVPFFQDIFRTTALPLEDWYVIVPMALSVFVIMEIVKFVRMRTRKSANL